MEKLSLDELRIKIDQLNEELISSIKHRSRFLLNKAVFEKEFAEGKSWFLYRLKKEQDLDSVFGRFLFGDQQPMLFDKKDLEKPLIKRNTKNQINPVKVDLSEKIITHYMDLLKNVCEEGENELVYGEVTKLDVSNVLLINERTVGIGEMVAEYKINKDKSLLQLKDRNKIRQKLFRPDREEQVINEMKKLAEKYGILNIEAIGKFAKVLIDLTMHAEIEYIIKRGNQKRVK